MKSSKRRPRRRRLLIGTTLLGVVAAVAMSLTLTAQAVNGGVTASYVTHTGNITPSAGTIPAAVNAVGGEFVQMDAGATITLAFTAGTYAAPDGTGSADITVHTYDALFRADAEVQVYVKSNINGWWSLGTIRDDQGDVGLNLEGVGLVNEVMLIQNGYIDPAYPTLGFDLDAVTAEHYVVLTESCDGVTPGTYAGWLYKEKKFASAVSLGVQTFGPLVEGVGYRFEAQGLYSAGPASGNGTEILADARYSQRIVGQATPGESVLGYEGFGPTLLDLLLDNAAADWQGAVFNAAHAYTADRVGAGAPAEFDFQVYDIYAANNIGGICVSLYEDDMAPAVTAKSVTPSLAQVGSNVQVAATIDDTGKGESWIAAAEWKVDGGSPSAMAPVNALDSKTESFTATYSSVVAGLQDVCVRGQDKAGNWGDWSCVELRVYDRWAKISGVVVGSSGATGPADALNVATDKGEPDWAFDGYAYAGGSDVWGSVSINYKSITGGPVTCTFTPGAGGQFNPYGPGPRPRVDLLNWIGSCSNGATPTISIQLVPRDSTSWDGITAPASFPRGGVFLNATPYAPPYTGAYDLFSGYAPFDQWVPLDRGNIHTWMSS